MKKLREAVKLDEKENLKRCEIWARNQLSLSQPHKTLLPFPQHHSAQRNAKAPFSAQKNRAEPARASDSAKNHHKITYTYTYTFCFFVLDEAPPFRSPFGGKPRIVGAECERYRAPLNWAFFSGWGGLGVEYAHFVRRFWRSLEELG